MTNQRSESVVEPLRIKEPDIYCVLFSKEGANHYGVSVTQDEAMQELVYRHFITLGARTFKMSVDELEGAVMGDFGEPPQVLSVIHKLDLKITGDVDMGVEELPFWLWCELQTTYSKEDDSNGWTTYRIN